MNFGNIDYNHEEYDRSNIILKKIEEIRKENNIWWLELYRLADMMSNLEIEEVKKKREKNNTQLINALKIICNNDIKEAKGIFRKILENDRKISNLFEKLLED